MLVRNLSLIILGGLAVSQMWAQNGRPFNREAVIAETLQAAALARNPVRGEARATSQALPTAQACCAPFGNFNFSGLLAVSPTSGDTACINCVPGVPDLDIGVKFPQSVLTRGQSASTTLTFHSQIPGPCTAVFVWLNQSVGPFASDAKEIADCGANNLWLVEFFNLEVPDQAALVGNNILIGVIRASDGTTRTDFEQFVIQ